MDIIDNMLIHYFVLSTNLLKGNYWLGKKVKTNLWKGKIILVKT